VHDWSNMGVTYVCACACVFARMCVSDSVGVCVCVRVCECVSVCVHVHQIISSIATLRIMLRKNFNIILVSTLYQDSLW